MPTLRSGQTRPRPLLGRFVPRQMWPSEWRVAATGLLTLSTAWTLALLLAVCTSAPAAAAAGETRVSIVDGRWQINGQPTNRGAAAEGLLMNVRMVNATFEDLSGKKPNFNAEANTEEFLAKIPDYAARGVNAFTLCLQGGMPGYEGAVNSAFAPDGSLKPEYLKRVERVIRACDRQGLVVILGCYYQRQSKVLRDEAALCGGAGERRAVDSLQRLSKRRAGNRQ